MLLQKGEDTVLYIHICTAKEKRKKEKHHQHGLLLVISQKTLSIHGTFTIQNFILGCSISCSIYGVTRKEFFWISLSI